jgi:hypothetical protein
MLDNGERFLRFSNMLEVLKAGWGPAVIWSQGSFTTLFSSYDSANTFR